MTSTMQTYNIDSIKFNQAKQTLVIKEDLLKLQVEIEKRFNQLILWVVGTGLAVAGLVLATLKF
jgi:hypothetical protein